MEADWEEAIEFVLKMEGGAVAEHDPKDPGGTTKFGISQRAYPNLDIENLTLDQVKEIYKKDYWQLCCCDQLPRAYALCVFDTAVNQGPGRAIRLLQIVLNVDVDGAIGSKTISAAFSSTPRQVMRYLALRIDRYIQTIVSNVSLQTYSLNWTFRVLSLYELIMTKKDPA